MIKKFGWMTLFLTALTVSLFSGTKDIAFRRFSVTEGLSQSIVYCTFQDNQGFLWFGTEDGLNRYDGYEFSVLRRHENKTNSLSHNDIRFIHQDRGGLLWIGTFHGGLNRYDPVTGTFTRFKKRSGDPDSLSDDVVQAVYEDASGTLWFGTGDGLNRRRWESETFSQYRQSSAGPAVNNITAITAETPGILLLATSGGLFRFDTVAATFSPLQTGAENTDIHTLFRDRSGVLWLGTHGGGLVALDPQTNTFTRYAPTENRDNPGRNIINAVLEDRSGRLWVGTDAGLSTLDRATGIFTFYLNDPHNPISLSHNEIRSIYQDASGSLWIGTYGGGINQYNADKKKFPHYESEPGNPNSLSNNIVWSVCEDPDGNLWIGTHGGGLNKFDRINNRFTVYRTEPGNPRSLSNNSVRQVYLDSFGILWLGTNGGGLNRFDEETETFTHYTNEPGNPGSLSHNEIRSLYEDPSGDFWIGTHGNGLNRLNRASGTFTRYEPDENDPRSLSNGVVRSIYRDRAGVLWVATYAGGLNRLNPDNRTFTHYRADPSDPYALTNDYLFVLHEDASRNLWIGAWGGGLNCLDPERKLFKHYGMADGFPSNAIYGILEDDTGNLWISSTNGISRFNPRTGAVRNYRQSDGLQSSEFNGGSYYKSPGGEMFFGGINGFNAFFPNAVKDNPYIPPIVITSFQKLNREVTLDRPIPAVRRLTLSHKDYFFSFEFSALDFIEPGENKYAYKMEGLDKDWIYTGSDKRFASYTTLAPGSYTFKVKGSNNDGVWNETGAAIHITITPPFWKTWWFLGGLLLLAVLAGWGIYRKRMNTLFLTTRMETELQTAHNAQMSIMPQQKPDVNGFDIHGVCIPANEVGGDFFDYLWLDLPKDRFGIAVGDVSGKAMQAAIPAVMSTGIIFSQASETRSITDIMSRLNLSLYAKTDKKVFTALMIAAIDTAAKTVTYTNAGLPDPLLKSGDTVDSLKTSGSRFPLGIVKDKTFSEETLPLRDGDILVLYTDGISESWDPEHRFYGKGHLARFLRDLDTLKLSAREIVDEVLADIKQFSQNIEPHDDITLVVVKVLDGG